MKSSAILLSILFLFTGCSLKIAPEISRTFVHDSNASSITIYYSPTHNIFLDMHRATVMIDGKPYYYLKCGEQVTFYLPAGKHEIAVSDTEIYFEQIAKVTLSFNPSHSYNFKVYPAFKGVAYIPYWFLPVPVPDIRFYMKKIEKRWVEAEMRGKPVIPEKRAIAK